MRNGIQQITTEKEKGSRENTTSIAKTKYFTPNSKQNQPLVLSHNYKKSLFMLSGRENQLLSIIA